MKQLVFTYDNAVVSLGMGGSSRESFMTGLWDEFFVGNKYLSEDKQVVWHEVKFSK